MVKRSMDLLGSALGLVAASPILLPVMFLVWLQDYYSPFYIAERIGKNGIPFRMVKLRSMVVNADKSGVDSTASSDSRITPVGKFIRAYKLDELSQLWNVLKGDMSLVGPRPQVARDVALYTAQEQQLLNVKPGITDISSIVFSDEGEILNGRPDPDLAYNQLIRPWKSRLGLLYIEKQSTILDLRLIWLTAIAVVSRRRALEGVVRVLQNLGASDDLIRVAQRAEDLTPSPPPGASEIVMQRA